MRGLPLSLALLSCACGDPYEAASREKLLNNPGCNITFGVSQAAHVVPSDSVSALTLCNAGPGGGSSGFVIVTGSGSHSAYGDTKDPFMPNAIPESGTCAGGGGEFAASRAFWAQIQRGLRARFIAQNGSAMHEDCNGRLNEAELLAIRIVDWAELDVTLAIVQTALRDQNICSSLAVEVVGVPCVRAL